jgi:hypothetical protein
LLGDLRGALEDLLTEGSAVFGALVTVDALWQLVDQPVFVPGEPDVRIDDLLAVLGADRFIVG